MSYNSRSDAVTLTCKKCKAVFETQVSVSHVVCSFCGQSQKVDSSVLKRLREYKTNVDEAYSQAQEAEQHAAAWQRSTDSMSKGRPALQALAIIIPTVFISVLGAFLIHKKILSPEYAGFLGPIITLVALVAVTITVVLAYGKRKKAGKPTQATYVIRCPKCAADNHIAAGEVMENCSYCGAVLMPSKSVRQHAVDEAREQKRRALMKRYRAERQGMAAIQRVGMGGATIYFVAIPFLLMIGGGAVGFSISMYQGEEPFSPAIFVIWAMFFALIATLIAIIKIRKARKQRITQELGLLATSLGGGLLDRVTGEIDWLNTYWAGPFKLKRLYHGPYFRSAQTKIGNHQLFIHFEPTAISKDYKAEAVLLLACSFEEGKQNSDSIKKLKKQLSETGFEISFDEAGITAESTDPLSRQLLKPGAPERLREPLILLSRLGDALEAIPQTPIP